MWVGVYVCVDVRVGVGRVGRRRTGGVCECGVGRRGVYVGGG